MVFGLSVFAAAIVVVGFLLLTRKSPPYAALSAFAMAALIVPFALAIRPWDPGTSEAAASRGRVVFAGTRTAIPVAVAFAVACACFAVFGAEAWLAAGHRITRFFLLGLVVAAISAIGAVVEAVRTLFDRTIVIDAHGVTAVSGSRAHTLPWAELERAVAVKGRLRLYVPDRLSRLDPLFASRRYESFAVRRNRTDPAVIAGLIQQWIDDPMTRPAPVDGAQV